MTEVLRIDHLARPKRLPLEYKDDRRSVYWVEKEPMRGGPDGHTVFIATPRVCDLARHRTVVGAWRPHSDPALGADLVTRRLRQYVYTSSSYRPTPIWPVADGAKSATATARVGQLAQHRNAMPTYSFDRHPEWEVSRPATQARPTGRLEQLANPKPREEKSSNFDPYWGFNIGVSQNAMRARCSERLDILSEAKAYHRDFRDERPIQSIVSTDAMEAIASLRLQQLARPRSRTMIKDDYDPYKIAQSAKKTRATPRLEELCIPIPRKVRQKKVVKAAAS